MTSYLIAQLGARMHYAVPRILHGKGLLDTLHTDICAVKGWPAVLRQMVPSCLQPMALQRLLGRVPEGVPPAKIRAYTSFGWEYAKRRKAARGFAEMTVVHLWAGEAFNRLIIRHGLGDAAAVYALNSAGLVLMQEAKRCGLKTVMEQTIAPLAIERELLDPELDKFPDMQKMIEPKGSWQCFADCEAAEWELADIILCGSQFVVDGIRKAGGPAEKAVVVPYGIDLAHFTPDTNKSRSFEELKVLFVGQVGIRKGAHFLIEAARLLEKSRPEIHFRFVGAIALPASILESLPSNVVLTGPVPRAVVREQFAWADLFCLPSLCEGSATVTYEALAMGLPVVCTPNTGSVVTDGVDGYIVPVCNVEGIMEKLAQLASAPELLRKMSKNACRKASEYTIHKYGVRLVDAITEGDSNK